MVSIVSLSRLSLLCQGPNFTVATAFNQEKALVRRTLVWTFVICVLLPVHHRQLRISSDSRLQIRVRKNTANIAAGGWRLAAGGAEPGDANSPEKCWLAAPRHRSAAAGRCSWAAAGGAAL